MMFYIYIDLFQIHVFNECVSTAVGVHNDFRSQLNCVLFFWISKGHLRILGANEQRRPALAEAMWPESWPETLPMTPLMNTEVLRMGH